MITKKYPIRTKIKFLYRYQDTNKIGIIVGFRSDNRPIIFLPTARKHIEDNHYPTLSNGTKFTWKCNWDEVEPIGEQQLEFSFMYE